jgi:hypothetical protein
LVEAVFAEDMVATGGDGVDEWIPANWADKVLIDGCDIV